MVVQAAVEDPRRTSLMAECCWGDGCVNTECYLQVQVMGNMENIEAQRSSPPLPIQSGSLDFDFIFPTTMVRS